MIRNLSFIVAVAIAAPAFEQAADPAPVVAAERAFAAETARVGINRGFTHWSVDNAVVFDEGRASTVRQTYPDRERPADEPNLNWWPNFAGIARSGDLGFTTGGVEVGGRRTGHYFTVWKRQADGAWKWVYDGGSGATAAGVPGPETEPVAMAPGSATPMNPDQALKAVGEAEARLAEAAGTDQRAAHLAVLADDARVYVARQAPAAGKAEAADVLAAWPKAFLFAPMTGGGASDAGDLVWTYGEAAWEADNALHQGWFVRVWRRDEGEVWRLVFVQLVPGVPPPPLRVTTQPPPAS
ncbi:MAG: DUF4440 domain-containing protein [Caulobacteraceae bacterium]|nr:DUF4440 domain-containing protein [Caulobacteraceae bacterium]